MKTAFLLTLAASLAGLAPHVAGAELARRGFLGAKLSQGGSGPVIDALVPSGGAERLGLRSGDRITSISSHPVSTVDAVVEEIGRVRAGVPLSVRFVRDGVSFERTAALPARPTERYPGSRTTYGAVAFRGGLMRDILVTPSTGTAGPVLFHIQGFTCASIEAPDETSFFAKLASSLSASGIAYYRVEKPGVGDSAGGVDCRDIDYATELDAFRSAYRHLVGDLGYSPDRVFMLGHSLGGLEAPMLAAERAPRGVAAFGTVLRNWADYIQELNLYQAFMMTGADPVEGHEKSERRRELVRLFYLEKRTPADIANQHPELREELTSMIGWDGATNTFGRHFKYLQDLPDQRLIKAWRETRSNVLALYGEADEVALFSTDHRMIADVVNHYRPGTAEFIEIPGTMHAMDLVGDRATFRARNMKAGRIVPGPFNPAVADALVRWIKDCMSRPPVK